MMKSFCSLAFAWLTIVKPSEGLIFGDVGVEELERVLWDNPVWDHFVVSDDVGKWESAEPVFSVWLHRVELHFPCYEKLLLAKHSIRSTKDDRTETQLKYNFTYNLYDSTQVVWRKWYIWKRPHHCRCAPPRWKWFLRGGSHWSVGGMFLVLCPLAECAPSLYSQSP